MSNVAAIMTPVWPQTITKEQKLQQWLDAKKALDEAKAAEAVLRVAVIALYPFDEDVREGTQYIDLANGYKLKVVKKQNYKLANKENETDKALDKLEALGERGKLIAERLVKWSPELSISEYRLLGPDERGIIDEVLTVSPGLPTVELVEPKSKG